VAGAVLVYFSSGSFQMYASVIVRERELMILYEAVCYQSRLDTAGGLCGGLARASNYLGGFYWASKVTPRSRPLVRRSNAIWLQRVALSSETAIRTYSAVRHPHVDRPRMNVY